MKKIILYIILFFTLQGVSQQYPYFKIGEEEFQNIEIYDVIQDEQQIYWLATNRGIIVHNGYEFKQVDVEESVSTSFFNLKKGKNGVIYFHNLQNQIFELKNSKISLFHQVNNDDTNLDIAIETDTKDNLIVLSKLMNTLNSEGNALYSLDFSDAERSFISLHRINDKLYCSNSETAFLLYDPTITSNFSSYKIKNEFFNTSISNWISTANKTYGLNSQTMMLYEVQGDSLMERKRLLSELKKSSIRLYYADEKIWLTGNFNGVYLFDENFNSLNEGKKMYGDFFISDIFTDAEQNILLSTFDQGILVIPNTKIMQISLPTDAKITALGSDQNSTLFIGTNDGKIYNTQIESNDTKIIFQDVKPTKIEHLSFWNERNKLFHTGFGGYTISSWDGSNLFNRTINGSSLKATSFLDGNYGFLAKNNGVSAIFFENNEVIIPKLNQIQKRAYCISIDKSDSSIYIGLADGLVRISFDQSKEVQKIGRQVIHAYKMVASKGKVFVASKRHGILIFSEGNLIDKISIDLDVKQMKIVNNHLYILTPSSLEVFNVKTHQKDYSLEVSNWNFIEILDGKIYSAQKNTVSITDIDQFIKNIEPEPITLDSILFNNQTTSKHIFPSGQNKIEFFFSVKTLKNRAKVHYQFKLEGYDQEWQTLNYKDHHASYAGLNSGNYRFMVKSINGNAESEVVYYEFKIKPPFYQTVWFYVIVFLLLLLMSIIFFSLRIKRINRKNEIILTEEKTKKALLESELKALRSQMNPHFIFNSLNSIQELILDEDTENSYDYIVLFADLVRNTLNYSSKEFIPFEKEIEFLEVYLSLEKLRFKDDFSFLIDVNNVRNVKIPSMLIQPFIENALIHGLIHKKHDKQLKIRFELSEKLICYIEDNGVGREKANEIKKRQSIQHESFALEAIQKRLAIFNTDSKVNVGYEVEDLYENGAPSGTRIILSIPFKKMY